MTGNVTWEAVLALIVIFGAISGIWWRIEGRIEARHKSCMEEIAKLRTEYELKIAAVHAAAMVAAQQLAEYKVEVAQTYVDKTGVREVKDEILAAMSDVKGSVDRVNERLDRVIEGAVAKARPVRHG